MNTMLYAPLWPHERTGWLRNATNHSYALGDDPYSKFSFDLPLTDTHDVTPGSLVGFQSAYGFPDFLGWVDRVETSQDDAYLSVQGREWLAILDERFTEQERTYTGGSGEIAAALVRMASGKNPTGVLFVSTGSGTPVPSPFTVRSDSVLAALSALGNLTGQELVVSYTAGVRANVEMFWGSKGKDVRETVHLWGRMISTADYLIDVINDSAIVNVVASSGAFGDRPSAVASEGALALRDSALVRVSQKNIRQRRGIATSRETVIRDAGLPDALSAQKRAVDALTAVLSGAEVISVTVTTLAPWAALRLGNIITVRLPKMLLGEDVIRPFKILGLQPFEDRGLMEVIGKVVSDA